MRAKAPIAFVVVGLFGSAGAATGQLPFDITREDLARVDSAAMVWTAIRDFVGGVDGALEYRREEVGEGECRAVVLAAARRLRRVYTTEHGELPLTLRLTVRCGPAYEARLSYDGLVALLELRDRAGGTILYRGRRRGTP